MGKVLEFRRPAAVPRPQAASPAEALMAAQWRLMLAWGDFVGRMWWGTSVMPAARPEEARPAGHTHPRKSSLHSI